MFCASISFHCISWNCLLRVRLEGDRASQQLHHTGDGFVEQLSLQSESGACQGTSSRYDRLTDKFRQHERATFHIRHPDPGAEAKETTRLLLQTLILPGKLKLPDWRK